MKGKIRAHMIISGRVQGVFFRQNTFKKAKKLGVLGWVRNLPDGRVEIIFDGDKSKVEDIVNWAKKGPVSALVKDFEIEWKESKEVLNDFKIL